MLDRLRLRNNAVLCWIVAIVLKLIDNEASMFVAAMGTMAVILYLSVSDAKLMTDKQKNRIGKVIKDATDEDALDIAEWVEENPEKARALLYVVEATSKDFMIFVRTAVELRTSQNDKVLNLLRRKK